MDEFVAIIITRSLERITAILLGGGTIYMAYRLFYALPNITDTDNFRFRQYVNLHLFKISLGALFLMFGGYIVLSSLHKTPSFEEKIEAMAENTPATTTRSYSGMRAQNQAASQPCPARDSIISVIDKMNRLTSELSLGLASNEANIVYKQISRSKLAVMESIWDDQAWGSWSSFLNWVQAGEKPELTPNQAASDIYFSISH